MTTKVLTSILRFFIVLCFLALNPFTFSEKIPFTASRVPADSFLVISANIDSLIKKSNIKENQVWEPLLEVFRKSNPEFLNFLFEPNRIGLNNKIPVQFFLRTDHTKDQTLSFGLLCFVKNTEKFDTSIANIAESLNFKAVKQNIFQFHKEDVPLEFGRKGRIFYILGRGQNINNSNSTENNSQKLITSLPDNSIAHRQPSSLQEHLSKKSDIAIYLDGSGVANLAEKNWPDDRWKKLLPLFDPFFNKQIGLNIHSNLSSVTISVDDFRTQKKENQIQTEKVDLLDMVPGDSPFVGKLSLPKSELRSVLDQSIDLFLKTLSNNQLNKDTPIPGFDSSPSEILSFPNGEFVFSGGFFGDRVSFIQNGKTLISHRPIITLGIGIDNKIGRKQLFSILKSSNPLLSILSHNNMEFTDHADSIWLSSSEHSREIKSKNPIRPLSKKRKAFLNKHRFALDLNINSANKFIRNLSTLSYEQLAFLNILDDFANVSLYEQNSSLHSIIKLNESKRSGWEVIFQHIGQSIIDQTNKNIFAAIAQNNLNSTIKAVQEGALINATDRFGHSPLHYAAYKGNSRIVDYLLRNGGDPNTKGRHESTPLHSAAWGRNIDVLELLLEDGAHVDARTDEGETPCMTAALRGEKEMLEILFALSADPHAKDIHGTNLVDLAAAGGHKSIVDLLEEIGVKNQNPLHVAAGLGNLEEVKKLLKAGNSINSQDAFGATPLLVAMVSGKEEIVDFLLSQKANPKISAKDGYTIMHGAAFSGKKSLVKKALSFDLDVNSRYGKSGITPVDVAEDSGDALPYLRSLGGKTAWELGRISN